MNHKQVNKQLWRQGTNTLGLKASLPGLLKDGGAGEGGGREETGKTLPTILQIKKFVQTTICKAAVLCQSLQVTEDTATDSVLMKLRI